jgi:hypothetical protein
MGAVPVQDMHNAFIIWKLQSQDLLRGYDGQYNNMALMRLATILQKKVAISKSIGLLAIQRVAVEEKEKES